MALSVHMTGGKGFLGRHIQQALDGHCALEISDIDSLDVTDQQAVTERLQAGRPDVVVHLAGLMGAGASLQNPRRFFDVNCGGAINVMEACRLAGVKGVVFLSSLTVHGQTRGEPVTEDSPMRPRHPYAGAKAAAELAVRTYAGCYGIKTAILRPTLIAAEGASEPNAISEFIATVERGEPIDLFGDGSHKREWLHPSDVGTAVRAAVQWTAGEAGDTCETFLISSGTGVSMAQIAEKVIAATGQGELTFTPSNRQAFDLCTASDKARTEFGWRPEIDVDEIIRRMVAAARGGS